MEVRTQPNFNFDTGEDVFGLSIRVDGGRRYCKYPVGHQSYKTIGDATAAAVKLKERISIGAHIEYGKNGSAGINKAELVKIVG